MDFANVLGILEKDAVEWAKAKSIRVALEDRPFTEAENEKRFIKHSVRFGFGEATSLGGQCFRYPGLQYLSLMYRTGNGLNSLMQFADDAVQRFSVMTLENLIVFGTASHIQLPQDAKGLAQLQIICPFYFDITRS